MVVKTDESSGLKATRGTELMRSVGGGVRARLYKDDAGKYVVESYHFDRDRFTTDGAIGWIERNAKAISESCAAVQEAAPMGSFTDLTLKAMRALNAWDYFSGQYCYIYAMFPDYCVVECQEQLWRVPFTQDEGRIMFGEPKKVDMTFVARECDAQNLKFQRVNRADEGLEFCFESTEIREVKEDKRQVVAVLIEAGTNYSKRRHYPKETIKESAPLFAKLKMYIDHPTPTEDREKPERSIRDWVSTIAESWYEDGKAMGLIDVHDDWLWSKLKEDETFRSQIGLSINASGRRHNKVIEGQNMEVIEEIVSPKSVDWVTEPGARGRVAHLVESQARKEDEEMLKTVTLEQLKKERPDLLESIKTEVEAEKKTNPGLTEAQVAEIVEKGIAKALEGRSSAAAEAKKKLEAIRVKVTSIVEASKMPKKAISTFIERFMKQNGDATEENVEDRVKEAVEAELKYLSECGAGSGVRVGIGGASKAEDIRENAAVVGSEGFMNKLGIADTEKK